MIIGRGAEATIEHEGSSVIKDRVPKDYRHELIDKSLRTRRTRAEAKILEKAATSGIKVPKLLKTDKYALEMEFIEGKPVKEVLDKNLGLAKDIGKILAKLHDIDVVHGDLTTSNMILRKEEIVLIDFGLAFHSIKYEDKAVDIHLFKQALESKHHLVFEEAMKLFWQGYKPKELKQIKERFEIVESRGRNKAKY